MNLLLDGSVLQHAFPRGQVTDLEKLPPKSTRSREREVDNSTEHGKILLGVEGGAAGDQDCSVKSGGQHPATVESTQRKDLPEHLQHKCCQIIITNPDRFTLTDETEGTTTQHGGSTVHCIVKNLIWLS